MRDPVRARAPVHFVLMTSLTARVPRCGAPAPVLLWGGGMTIPTWLRGTIPVVAAALSLTLLAPRESFAQG